MASFPNTSRRMFRGRAGPTDRQLHKYQQRRRKKHPQLDETETNVHDNRNPLDNCNEDDESENNDDVVVDHTVTENDINDEATTEQLIIVPTDEEVTTASIDLHPVRHEELSPAAREIKHLCKRIRNVSESITLSATAISNPSTWKTNVLNAVLNTVNEWRAILHHYGNTGTTSPMTNTETDNELVVEEDNDDEITRATQITKEHPALDVYMLIQQAMQSGPLTGSNPGYFKRCGAVVAQQALEFLNDLSLSSPLTELRLSERQIQAIEKWKDAARKAVENGKEPSKSQLKKQAGKTKKSKKK